MATETLDPSDSKPQGGTIDQSTAHSDPNNEVFPPRKMLLLGLQHVLVMYSGAIAVPFIIGSSLNLSSADIAFLISADLFTCGIATLIQCVGVWKFGIRLPLMQGVSFISVTPIIAIGTAPGLIDDPHAAMQVIYGSIMAAGVFAIVAAPFASYIIRVFPPVVVGTVLMVIGISLMPVAITYAAGGFVDDAGAFRYIALAFFVLAVIALVNRLATGLLSNLAIMMGLLAGFGAAILFGMVDFSAVPEASWVAITTPFHFGAPEFRLAPILTMCLVVMITWVESTGDAMFVGELVGRPPKGRDIGNLIRADGAATFLGGVFNSFPYTAFSENVALVNITGVKSRWVVATAGVIIGCLGLFPKVSAIVAAIPKPVIGGAGFVMFGVLCAAGVKMLQKTDFDKSFNNFLIVGVSVSLAMIPIIKPDFFQFMPEWSQIIFQSSVMLGACTAIALNLAMNGMSKTTIQE